FLQCVEQACVDFVNAAVGVDRFQLAAGPVVLDYRFRMPAIDVETIGDRFLVVVLALNELTAGLPAFVNFFLRGKIDIEQLSCGRTGAAAGKPLQQDIEIDVHQNGRVQRFTHAIKQLLESLGLRQRSRKTVKDEAIRGVRLIESLLDY